MEQIGDGGGRHPGRRTSYPTYLKFRQSNQFFYLTGVEVPRAILVIDGRAKSSTLFLNPRDERAERSEGPVLTPGARSREDHRRDERPAARRVCRRGSRNWRGRGTHALHAASAGGARRGDARLHAIAHAQRSLEDPWDGRLSREAAFIARVKEKAPKSATVKDLGSGRSTRCGSSRARARSPSSARRRGSPASASWKPCVRPSRGCTNTSSKPIADYVFKKHNAQGIGYFALVAAGKNASWPHYHAAQTQDRRRTARPLRLRARLQVLHLRRDPDVSGERPVHGRPARALHHLSAALSGPHDVDSARQRAADILRDAVAKMDAVMASFTFANPKYQDAAVRFVDGYRKSLQSGRRRSATWSGWKCTT